MTGRSIAKGAGFRAVATLVSAVLAVGTAQVASAGLTVIGQMKSTTPCAYSLELQKSPAERERYLVQLSRELGVEMAEEGAVEQMYGDIREASYAEDEGVGNRFLEFLGIETRQQREGRLDTFSVGCLTCHDGNNAVSVHAIWRNDPYREFRRRRSGTDHPVGMDYQSYVEANPREYKPLFGNGSMVLIDGKVGCLTCHNPLNPERRHLVMSDRQSALCLTCHDK